MDSKIISKLFFVVAYLTTTHLNAVEFKGKFIQGHYIVGVTDPSSKIIIDKKNVLMGDKKFEITSQIIEILNKEFKSINLN